MKSLPGKQVRKVLAQVSTISLKCICRKPGLRVSQSHRQKERERRAFFLWQKAILELEELELDRLDKI